MKSKVISTVIFFTILIIILFGLGFLLSPEFLNKNNIVDRKGDLSTRLEKEEPDSLDIIILGDSESYTSISPMEWWKDYGYTSYNFGEVGAKLSDVKEAYITISSKQSPKYVLLESNSLYKSDVKGGQAENFLTRIINTVLPITKYHDNWKIPFLDKRKGNYKGFTISQTIDPCENKDYMSPTDEKDVITSDNYETLKEINDLCKKNGAVLILYSAPSPTNYTYAKHNALCEVASELGVNYVDMNIANDEIKIDYTTDTRDRGDHLNIYGAVKSTAYMGHFLRVNYDIPDRRNSDIAESWNKILDYYNKEW